MWVFSRQSNNYGRSEKQNNVEIVSEREKKMECAAATGGKRHFNICYLADQKRQCKIKNKKGPKTINKEKGLIHAFNKWLYTGLEEKEGKSMSLGRQQP